jgi:hypothetical protein
MQGNALLNPTEEGGWMDVGSHPVGAHCTEGINMGDVVLKSDFLLIDYISHRFQFTRSALSPKKKKQERPTIQWKEKVEEKMMNRYVKGMVLKRQKEAHTVL